MPKGFVSCTLFPPLDIPNHIPIINLTSCLINLKIQPFLVPFIQFPSFRQLRHMLVASKSPSWFVESPCTKLDLVVGSNPHFYIFLPHHFFPRSTCAPPDALGVAVGLQHGLQVSRHPIESIQLDAAGNRRAVQGHGVEILVLPGKPMETNGIHGTMMELLGKT